MPDLQEPNELVPPVVIMRQYDLWAGNGVQKLSEGELRAYPFIIKRC